MIKPLTGGQAAAEALRQIQPAVFAAYPITPQTPIIESFAEFVASGKADTEFLAVESEHSALSAVVGAEATGVRAVTATASQGLAYMFEMLPIASGLRLPILMNVCARALSSPINIHCDHSDVMAVRDTGWLQIFTENPQEVYDFNFIGLKLAESVSLPVMIIQDGFITSHCVEKVEMLADSDVIDFVGKGKIEYSLRQTPAITIGPLVMPDYQMETKENQAAAFDNALEFYPKIVSEFAKISGRNYGYFEAHEMKEAKAALVALGSSAGTIRHVIKHMRRENQSVGLVKPYLFRPFPYREVNKVINSVPAVGVLDRALSYGAQPPLYSDVLLSLWDESFRPEIASYIYGLGGRDFQPKDAREMFESLLRGSTSKIL